MIDSQLATIVLFCLLGWALMWADYGLTLVVARAGQARGIVYELNPLLRADVTARRWRSPRFLTGTTVLLGGLLGMGWWAMVDGSYSVVHAVLAGLIVTRLYLIGRHLMNWWNQARRLAAPVPTTRQAMLATATQQTALAVVFTLLAAANPLPTLYTVWLGAAAGFLLMATTILFWQWRERYAPLHPRRVLPRR